MKLVMGLVAGLLVLGGAACGKSSAPQEPAQVQAGEKAPEGAKPAEGTTVAAAKTDDKAAAHACGDHAGHEKGNGYNEADCPFEHERKQAAAEVAAKPEVKEAHAGCDAEPMPGAGGPQHLGTAFTITDNKPLSDVLKVASAEKEELVRVAGTVEKVCQKKGCWMVVKDGDLEARVIMKDHSFAIPFDSKGMKASIEGTLKVKVFTEAQAKHLAQDGKEDPDKVTGEKKEFLLTATGVQLGG